MSDEHAYLMGAMNSLRCSPGAEVAVSATGLGILRRLYDHEPDRTWTPNQIATATFFAVPIAIDPDVPDGMAEFRDIDGAVVERIELPPFDRRRDDTPMV